MIYIVTFFISTIFVYLGDKYKGNRIFSKVLLIAGVLFVSILAGVRDLSIGTDIKTYGEWLFKGASSGIGFFSFIKANSDIEPLFLALVYAVAKFFSDSHWLYFAIGLLQYGFTLAGIMNFRGKISVPYSWFCFLLIFYGDTLNAMRQFIALASAFWAFYYFFKGEYKKYVVWTIIAVLFHNTAIVSFFIAVIYFVLKNHNTFYTRVGIVVAALFATSLYSVLLQFFINVGLFSDKYTRYLGGSSGFSINPILIRLPFIILILVIYKQFCNYQSAKYQSLEKYNTDFLIIMLIIEMLTAEMRALLPALYRISFCFGYAKCIAYSRIAKVHTKNERVIYSFTIIVFLIILWVYQNVLQGNNEIYPYTSIILGIL